MYFEGIDEAKVRTQLLEEYNLEIGAGLGSLAGKASSGVKINPTQTMTKILPDARKNQSKWCNNYSFHDLRHLCHTQSHKANL